MVKSWTNERSLVFVKIRKWGGGRRGQLHPVRAPRIENADKRGKLSIDRDSGCTRIKHAGTRSFDAEIYQY